MISDRICQFINRWLFETSIEKGPLRKVGLMHISKESNTGREVTDWPIKSDDPSALQVPTFVAQILELAQEDANGWGGVQQYVVCGYFGSDAADGGRTIVFPVASERRDPDMPGERGLMPTEPANERGGFSQMLRFNEALHKITLGAMGSMIESLTRQNMAKDHLIEKMGEKHIQNIVQVEQLLDNKAERDIELSKQQLKNRSMDMLTTSVMPLLPSLVNRFLGVNIFQDQSNPGMEQMRQFLGSLREEQITKFVETLDPPQALAVMHMYEQAREMTLKMEEDAKRKAAAASGARPDLQIVKASP